MSFETPFEDCYISEMFVVSAIGIQRKRIASLTKVTAGNSLPNQSEFLRVHPLVLLLGEQVTKGKSATYLLIEPLAAVAKRVVISWKIARIAELGCGKQCGLPHASRSLRSVGFHGPVSLSGISSRSAVTRGGPSSFPYAAVVLSLFSLDFAFRYPS
jgi:hypothetical protein